MRYTCYFVSLPPPPALLALVLARIEISMESVIEQQRKLHEERERLEDAIVKEKTLKKATVSWMPELSAQWESK